MSASSWAWRSKKLFFAHALLLKAVTGARQDVKAFLCLKNAKKFCIIGKKMYLCNPKSKNTFEEDYGLIR